MTRGLARSRRLPGWTLAAGAGAVAALGHAPAEWPLVAVLGFAGLLALLAHAPDARAAGRRAWIGGVAYFAVALHWIVEPFLVDIARHGWMAPFALVLLAGGLALFWGVAGALAAWLAPPRAGRTARLAALVVCLTGAEVLRATILTGFPWAMPATIWADTPARLPAAWIGPHGLTFATLSLAAVLAAVGVMKARARVVAAGMAACLLGALHLGGLARLAALPATAGAEAPVLRLVQPNAPQHLKWRDDMIPVFWARKLDLTAADPLPDLVVWPEVSLPYLAGTRPDRDAAIAAAAQGAPVIAGAQRFVGDDLHNSAAVIAPDGSLAQVYDKHHLVPFGEYFPGGALAERLGLAGLATDALGGFSPGPGPALLDLRPWGLGRALPLICYEAIFPRHAMPPGGERPDWIVQVTNDAWFGRFAGPQQHLAQARMRAVEQGLPLVRVANTGISAVIDSAGRLRGTLALDTHGALDAALPAPGAPTLFSKVAHWPLAGVLALIVAALCLRRSARS